MIRSKLSKEIILNIDHCQGILKVLNSVIETTPIEKYLLNNHSVLNTYAYTLKSNVENIAPQKSFTCFLCSLMYDGCNESPLQHVGFCFYQVFVAAVL